MTDYIFNSDNTVVLNNDVHMKFYGRWYCIDMDISSYLSGAFRDIKGNIERLDSLEDAK